MKKHSLILVLAVCLLVLTALVSCNGGNNTNADTASETWLCACGAGGTGNYCSACGAAKPTDETTCETTCEPTADETSATTEPESGTAAATEDESEESTVPAETEAETSAPRYDYFSADVKADVTIDPSAYAAMQLTLPASLQITAQDVTDYIEKIRFQNRVTVNGNTQVTDKPLPELG